VERQAPLARQDRITALAQPGQARRRLLVLEHLAQERPVQVALALLALVLPGLAAQVLERLARVRLGRPGLPVPVAPRIPVRVLGRVARASSRSSFAEWFIYGSGWLSPF